MQTEIGFLNDCGFGNLFKGSRFDNTKVIKNYFKTYVIGLCDN